MDFITLISTIVLASLFVGLIFIYQARKPITQVEQLRPRDRRFEIMTVNTETDLSLHCKKKGGAFWRFIKRGTAWVGNIGGRPITKFFGVEGRAFTTIFRDEEEVELSISEYLRDIWGEVFFNQIPEPNRRKLENIGLTVEPIQSFGDLDEGINAEQVNDEDERNILRGLAETAKSTTKQDIYKAAIPFLLGAFFMYFIVTRGYLP